MWMSLSERCVQVLEVPVFARNRDSLDFRGCVPCHGDVGASGRIRLDQEFAAYREIKGGFAKLGTVIEVQLNLALRLGAVIHRGVSQYDSLLIVIYGDLRRSNEE